MKFKKRYIPYALLTIILLGVLMYFSRNHFINVTTQLSCWSRIQGELQANKDVEAYFHKRLLSFQELLERNLSQRSLMLQFYYNIQKHRDEPLTSEQLMLLKEGTLDYTNLRDDLYSYALNYECAINANEKDLKKYKVSEDLRSKAVMMSLAAGLSLYDNHLLSTMLFENDKRLRRILNDADQGFDIEENSLMKIMTSAVSYNKLSRFQNVIEFYENNILNVEHIDDAEYEYLKTFISQSPSYNYVKNLSLTDMTVNKINFFEHVGKDAIAEMRDEGFNNISMIFGNSVGLYEQRKGKLFGDEKSLKKLSNILQPLDIILEKTPFRLTDKLIPGHFGHVAIWVGGEEELKELDLWDNEIVAKYHHELNTSNSETASVVEALRDGVQLNTLSEFMNVDDVAILRPVFSINNEKDKIREALLLTFRQLGKKYDFNFDVNTTDKIVCSELAYVSFPSIDWNTEKTLGRYTISPDNVAKLCWQNKPLKLISFYHDGNEINKKKSLPLLIKLMQE